MVADCSTWPVQCNENARCPDFSRVHSGDCCRTKVVVIIIIIITTIFYSMQIAANHCWEKQLKI